jgi:hypothetical protein
MTAPAPLKPFSQEPTELSHYEVGVDRGDLRSSRSTQHTATTLRVRGKKLSGPLVDRHA